jgi:hypothetical protein
MVDEDSNKINKLLSITGKSDEWLMEKAILEWPFTLSV